MITGLTDADVEPLIPDIPLLLSGEKQPPKLGRCKLNRLVITGYNEFTEAALLAIARSCYHMQEVDVASRYKGNRLSDVIKAMNRGIKPAYYKAETNLF